MIAPFVMHVNEKFMNAFRKLNEQSARWLVAGDLNTTLGHRHDLYSAALLYAYAPHHHFPSPDSKRRFEITIISFSRSICRGGLAVLIGVIGKPYPNCLSCHSHPIRPCGAPSPRGKGFDAGEAVFSFCSLYRWCSGQRICMTAE